MPNYQTDFEGWIEKDGCLCFCLVRMAEKKVSQGLTHLKLADLIHVLHYKVPCSYDKQKPVLSDEIMPSLPGIFVWDHESVVNQALFFLNIYDLKIKYIGRKYTAAEEARGKISFGTHISADEMILGVQTDNGGHFILPPDYDPSQPATHIVGLKSARYYKWVKDLSNTAING